MKGSQCEVDRNGLQEVREPPEIGCKTWFTMPVCISGGIRAVIGFSEGSMTLKQLRTT